MTDSKPVLGENEAPKTEASKVKSVTEDSDPAVSASLSTNNLSTSSTESSRLSNPSLQQLTLDTNGKIQPYVSFDEYYKLIEEGLSNGSIPKSQIHLYK